MSKTDPVSKWMQSLGFEWSDVGSCWYHPNYVTPVANISIGAAQFMHRQMIMERKDQTEMLQRAEKLFGKVRFDYALRELDKDLYPDNYPNIIGKLSTKGQSKDGV